jgi:hypothetical protein
MAISVPTPHIFQASVKDVQQVFSPSPHASGAPAARDAAEEALDHDSRFDLVRTVIAKYPAWRARLASYWTLAANDKVAAEEFWRHHATLTDENGVSADSIRTVLKSIDTWTAGKTKLRCGACQVLYDDLTKWAEEQPDAASMDSAAQQLMLDVADAVLAGTGGGKRKMVSGKTTKKESIFVKIKVTVSESLSQSRTSTAVRRLTDALKEASGSADLRATDAALDACKGLELGQDVARDVLEFTASLEKSVVELAAKSSHVTPSFTDTIKQHKALFTKAVDFAAVKVTL